MSNTRKETCPHCDGCGYVEVPAPKEDAEPLTVKFCEVYDVQDIAKVEARIERQIKSLTDQMQKEYFNK